MEAQQATGETMDTILENNAENLLLEDSDPGEIIGRDNQKQELQKIAFDKILNGEEPVSTIYIYGSSGTGKTYVVDKLRESVESTLDPTKVSLQYINGRRHKSFYQVMVRIWNNLSNFLPVEVDGETFSEVKTRGFPGNKIFEVIKEIVKKHDLTLQITLDEIDKIKEGDAQELISTFYDMRKDGLSVQLICISNDPYQTTRFDSDIKRRIGYEMHFPKYNAIQLQKILNRFAEMALKEDTWDKKPLSKIAARIGQTSGSASEAKQLLYHTAVKSQGKLDPSCLDDAKEEVSKDMIRSEIITRPKHDMVTLQATAHLDSTSDWNRYGSDKYDMARKTGPTTANIHQKYKELCEKYGVDDPKSKKTVSRMLKNLQQDEIVEGDTRSGGRGSGVSTFWEPLYDSAIIEEIVESKLEFDDQEEEEQ